MLAHNVKALQTSINNKRRHGKIHKIGHSFVADTNINVVQHRLTNDYKTHQIKQKNN